MDPTVSRLRRREKHHTLFTQSAELLNRSSQIHPFYLNSTVCYVAFPAAPVVSAMSGTSGPSSNGVAAPASCSL